MAKSTGVSEDNGLSEKLAGIQIGLDYTDAEIDSMIKTLLNPDSPIHHRFRILFTLKSLGGLKTIETLLKLLDDSSVLLKHEAAYCLGQMQDVSVLPKLISRLKDKNENEVVRHECAEALAAIGDQSAKPILEQFTKDESQIVKETCEIGLGRLKWLAEGGVDDKSHYDCIDPAPPFDRDMGVYEAAYIYMDDSKPLFERYRAMFTIRNMPLTCETINSLAEGLEDESALFRHEVAFVFGQIQSSLADEFLNAVLNDDNEHEMVRHECAEALGSIASLTVKRYLKPFENHPNRLLRESAIVGMDLAKYHKTTDLIKNYSEQVNVLDMKKALEFVEANQEANQIYENFMDNNPLRSEINPIRNDQIRLMDGRIINITDFDHNDPLFGISKQKNSSGSGD